MDALVKEMQDVVFQCGSFPAEELDTDTMTAFQMKVRDENKHQIFFFMLQNHLFYEPEWFINITYMLPNTLS